jgi:hypothetical protein
MNYVQSKWINVLLTGKLKIIISSGFIVDFVLLSSIIILARSVLRKGQAMTHPDSQDGVSTEPDHPELDEAGSRDLSVVTDQSKAQNASDQVYGLKFILPNGEAKLFTSLPISIGRAEDNDIVLEDETVSAHHARIYYDQKAHDICILDLDSLNGLFIGDQPTRRNILNDGVKIGLGAATLIFRDTGFIYLG